MARQEVDTACGSRCRDASTWVLLVREAAVTTSAGSTPQDAGPTEGQPDLAAELRESREQLAAVNEVLSAVGRSAGDPDMVLTTIVESARRLCRSDAAQLCLLDDDRVFQLIKAVGISDQAIAYIAEHPLPLDRATLMGRVALDRRPQQIEDVVADPEYGRLDLQRVAGFRTIMGAPLVVDDEVVGAILLWRNVVSPFAERELIIAHGLRGPGGTGDQRGPAGAGAGGRSSRAGPRVDQLEALADVGEAVSSSLDADEVLTTIVTLAVELSGTDGGSLMEFDEETQLFSVRTASGTEPARRWRRCGARPDPPRRDARRAGLPRPARRRRSRTWPWSSRDPHLSVLYAAGWRSVVAIPMLRSDRVVGAMVVRRKTTGLFSDETCELLEAFASQSAIALTNARLYQQLEHQSAELAEASQHKSEFLASMSHELRTPLNAVIGFSEVLLERMFGELNERQEDYLRDILSSGEHLLALLNDVLDLSKVEAGQMDLDPTEFPVAARRWTTPSRWCASGRSRTASTLSHASRPGGRSRHAPTSCGSSRCCSTCSATP